MPLSGSSNQRTLIPLQNWTMTQPTPHSHKECEKSSWKWLQIKLDILNVATSPPMSAIWEVITIFPAFTGRGSIDRRDRIGSSRCSLTGPSHVHQGPDKDQGSSPSRGSPMLAPPWAWEPLLRLAGNSLGAGALRRSVLQAASDHFHECVLM